MLRILEVALLSPVRVFAPLLIVNAANFVVGSLILS